MNPPSTLRNYDPHRTALLRDAATVSAIDHWLAINIQAPYPSGYALMGDGPANEVICNVQPCHMEASNEDASIKDPDTFTLYITASALPESGVPPLSSCSPRATLARYVGFNHDPGAPYWTKWDKSVSFRQPRCLFADAFAQMANLEENRAVKGLSYRMIEWAKTISVGGLLRQVRTWLDSDTLAETPQNSQKFNLVNTFACKRYGFNVLESPCKRGRAYGAEAVIDADDEDEITADFIPRVLVFTPL
ncbi:hypothetical protein PILCRDRAFT_93270 [Piloderma croceum F 1598]|uniref:Uncharacterized protein n=1 Tax=Piloderma croceum (strain F 1598) TaxID=765440 RepID=A0A0C3EJW6_PILCF|nr:hypothetical protein PILCRDRAFT_93270 [Piloderma croceum F 1598]